MNLSRATWIAFGVAATMIASMALAFLAANLHAPVQRDGAHFAFMAVNIAAGQPAYWASFETKNPLVEYAWATGLLALGGDPVRAFRMVEHAWLAATAFALFAIAFKTLVRPAGDGSRSFSAPPSAAIALAAASTVLCASLDWRVTDDGFNIALYQALPELLAVLAMIELATAPSLAWGMLLGASTFLAWFTKQTSLVALAFPLVGAFIAAGDRRSFAHAVGAAAVLALAGLAAWFLYLGATGTTENYWLGTVAYKASISTALLPEVGKNVVELFTIRDAGRLESAVPQYHKFLAWGAAALLAVPAAALWCRRNGDRMGAITVSLAGLWFLGALVQAAIGLTFFRHYFLAALAPAVFLVVALLRPLARMHGVLFFALPMLAITIFWSHWYSGKAREFEERRLRAPLTDTVAQLRALIPAGQRVFNWNGLPHFHVASGKPSDYPLNTWWAYLMEGLPDAERDRMLAANLGALPPHFVIEIFEEYPPGQGLRSIRLTPDLLKRWTGRTYEPLATIQPPPGRYSAPARVWRLVADAREMGPPPTRG